MKLWPGKKQADAPTAMTTDPQEPSTTPAAQADSATPAKPVYQKPVLRRYDQIDQVKPYGPSEL